MRKRPRARITPLTGGPELTRILATCLATCLTSCTHSPASTADGGQDPSELPDLATVSCSGPTSFFAIRRQILPNCEGYGCHLSAPYAGELNLTGAAAYTNLVGRQAMAAPTLQRVKPGEPLSSFLWHKLDNLLPTDHSRGFPMPLGAENFWTPLSAEQRALVYCWIMAGAENN